VIVLINALEGFEEHEWQKMKNKLLAGFLYMAKSDG